MNEIREWIPFLIPLIIVEMLLLVITLRHILTHDHYRHGTRAMWLIITIVGMQLIGPVLYFLFGKEET